MGKHRLLASIVAIAALSLASPPVEARQLSSQVTQLEKIPAVRPEFPVPNEPHMLFYIQRSVNANTVVYAAHTDAAGKIDANDPVDVYWRWFNVDGHKKGLNFVERMMAYGVRSVSREGPANGIAFRIAALPERQLFLGQDARGQPEATIRLGDRLARLVYVYLQVDDSGMMPVVNSMDLFGIDTATGKALREHVVPS